MMKMREDYITGSWKLEMHCISKDICCVIYVNVI